MNFQFVTYRWDESFVGGAELHHRRLAHELDEASHEVKILTTNGGTVQNFAHWAVLWNTLTEPSASSFPVERVPIRTFSKLQLGWMATRLQRRYERETAKAPLTTLRLFFEGLPPGAYLCHGWHYPEFQQGSAVRWAHPRATFAVINSASDPVQLRLRGYNPVARTWTIETSSGLRERRKIPGGDFDTAITINSSGLEFVTIACSAWRPLKEFRSLAFMIKSASLTHDGKEIAEANIAEDLKDRGRAFPSAWQKFLHARAEARPWIYQSLIDMLRGPVVPYRMMQTSLDGDVNIFCNMPWSTISSIQKNDLAMPLWHVDDEFYYWKHWTKALRRAKFVLANTPYTAEKFFPNLNIRAHFVGPPIWQPETFPTPPQATAFRALHGIADDEVLVLTVCRKSGEKRYDAIASAVANLARAGLKIRMLGIGPDQDSRPFDYLNCKWIGQQTGDELQSAYAACDVFCLMSESESFGMVIPEAWHHGAPVIVNRLCGPSASLVADGVDGFLAVPGPDLEEKFALLARDPALRTRLGEAGKEKALRDYVRGAAAARLLKAMESEGMLR